jgi:lipoprotein-releasing system ATP-binding protein
MPKGIPRVRFQSVRHLAGHAMPDLVVRDVTKQFPTRGEPLVVLRGVSLELSAGESLAVIGPSGCGKSTLLHIIGTLDRPSDGAVILDGQDPFTLADDQLARFRNQQIGFVFQDHHLLPQCSALENVLLPTIASGPARPELIDRARTLLERVGLAERLDHRPAELSGGERQRAAIARALINSPKLLLADEPTGNLDRRTAEGVAELLLELQRRERLMLIVVTHSQALAERIGSRKELIEGRLEDEGVRG